MESAKETLYYLNINIGKNCMKELKKFRDEIQKKHDRKFTLAEAASHTIYERLGEDAGEEGILIYTQ